MHVTWTTILFNVLHWSPQKLVMQNTGPVQGRDTWSDDPHSSEMRCPPIIISNVTPTFHNRDSEYCLLSEEQNTVRMNPQQFLYYTHLSPNPHLATSSEVALTMHLLSLVFINSFRNMSLNLSSSYLALSPQFVVTHRFGSTEHSAVGFNPENGLHTVCTFLKTYCLQNCGVQGRLGSSNSIDRHFSDLRSAVWHEYVSQ